MLDSAECDLHDFGVAMIVLSWRPAELGKVDASGLDELLQELNLASQKTITARLGLAKGALAERLGIDPGEAFTLMRDYARNHAQRLTELAAAVMEGKVGTLPTRAPGPPPDQ